MDESNTLVREWAFSQEAVSKADDDATHSRRGMSHLFKLFCFFLVTHHSCPSTCPTGAVGLEETVPGAVLVPRM